MNKRNPAVMGLVMGLILLNGCAADVAAPILPGNATSLAAGSSASSLPSSIPSTSSMEKAPPAAAAMVCSKEAMDSVMKVLALTYEPKTTHTWNASLYTCDYTLADGPFAMSVGVTAGDAAAASAAKALASTLNAEPIAGLSNLGLSGYQSAEGAVVFAKDNMVLHVDATKMASTVGGNHVGRSDFAYQMATTILACWSEH